MTRAIGIDLGTTYTVVATLDNGRPRVLPNTEGQRLTPSVVAFTGLPEPLVGEAARRQASENPDRTAFSIKRRMGTDFRLQVGSGLEYTPQQISSFILRKAKKDAEAYLGERIDAAVITVPAYFNDRQRQATQEAGALAGLEVMRIISEPTATALAYGLGREDAQTILVWDLGGGTFDVSILDLGEGIFEVKAVSGDNRLGGDDFDERLAEHLAEEYKKALGEDFPRRSGDWLRLREAAEKAKLYLSSHLTARVSLPVSVRAPMTRPVEIDVRREQFEAQTADLLVRMVVPTRQALKDAALNPQDIDRVILAGGATRMPAVRNLVRSMFQKEPYRYVDPDLVVAMGAAIQAGILLNQVDRVVLLDVLPLSLGVEAQGGLMAKVVPRNRPLPASEARIFATAADNQTSMEIHVLQGEREMACDNVSLGRVQLQGIPQAARGVAKVEVAFEVDVDGIVHVAATDLLDGNRVKAKVASTKFLDSSEIRRAAQDARRHTAQDLKKRQMVEAGIEAENVIAAVETALKGPPGQALQEAAAPPAEGQSLWLARELSRLKEVVARGSAEETRALTTQLQQMLAALLKENGEGQGAKSHE